jgi:hypothetical protein
LIALQVGVDSTLEAFRAALAEADQAPLAGVTETS